MEAAASFSVTAIFIYLTVGDTRVSLIVHCPLPLAHCYAEEDFSFCLTMGKG